jgi:PAS domain S-box-containing protein
MNPATILIVEDEAVVALDLQQQLQELGYRVLGLATSGEEAIEAARAQPPQLILMDVRLRGAIDGIAAAQAIRQRHDVPVIFLTAHSDDNTVARAAHTAPYGYLTKPYQLRELRAGIEVALTKARIERQLREADRWFAHTLHCVADGVVLTHPDGAVRFLNPAAERLTGWALEDALGQPVAAVVQLGSGEGEGEGEGEGNSGSQQRIIQVLQQGRALPVVHAQPLRSRAGLQQVVDEAAAPVNDEAGQRLGAVLILRDAAQRLAQEAQLRASDARFRNAFDHAPLGMALVSFDGGFIQVNDALCQLLGLPREQLAQRNQAELTWASDRDHEAQRLHELARPGAAVVQFEKRYRHAGGQPLWVLVSVSVLRGAETAAAGACYLYQVHDLSSQKAAAEHLAALAEERLLRQASEMAHQANQAKSEFLSRVSHEMRTPLNAVMGFAQLLQLQQTPIDSHSLGQYAQHIHAAGAHLLALVNDLLDLNRAAQGTLKIQPMPLVLASVVQEALHLLHNQASSHGVVLDVQVEPTLLVLADHQRLRQVLVNLGSNAIKYNRQGGSVQIRAVAAASAGEVVLTISDQGIGMTAEQMQRLFQPFERLGAERSAVPGTGLGLVVSRGLVEQMGGTLSLSSTAQSGTTATLRLRAAP